MNGRLETILWMWDVHAWARPRVLEAASLVPEEDLHRPRVIAGGLGEGSLFEVLAHIAGAESLWLRRWQGVERPQMPPLPDDLQALASDWTNTENQRRELLSQLTTDEAEATLDYLKASTGAQESIPLWQTMIHCSNHTTLHREDACTAMTLLGIAAPAVDTLDYTRELRDGLI